MDGRFAGLEVAPMNDHATGWATPPQDAARVEQHLKGLVDSIDGIVWEFDLATLAFTFVSGRAERLLGYPVADWYRPGFWTDILHPDDRDWALGFCMARTRCMEAHDFEYRVLARDGRVVWVRDIVSVVVEEGKPVRLRGIMVDITERKVTEKRLVLMDFALDHVREVACLTDAEGRILHVNEEACRVLGYDRAALAGMRAADVVAAYAREDWPARAAELARAGALTLETELVSRDGARVPVELSLSGFQHEGSPYLLALARDIGERQRLERTMRELNQTLERRVAMRTAQYEVANRELEAFAYTVSHDLRAPLRHVGAYVELLRRAIAPVANDQARHYADVIVEEARRMDELVEGLLAFSRMGQAAMTTAPVELGALLREVVADFAPETAGRDVRWRLGALPTVQGDRTMLRAVLSNLLGNALKFTRPRAPAEIEVGAEARAGETIVFVRDNGVGFDPAHAGKLFGIFERLHRADEFEGNGIGLAHVRRIVSRHGGRIWAEGERGKGAAFYFSLPHAAS